MGTPWLSPKYPISLSNHHSPLVHLKIIFGIFLILSQNINHFVDDIKSEQGFQVFLTTDATEEEIQEAGDKIRALNGVSTVEFKDKEYALNVVKERFGDQSYLVEGFGYEYFSTSYIVTLTDLNLSKDVQGQILQFENIKKITSRDETVVILLKLANVIRIITAAILILLIVISIFIISNTIKLTVHARRKEISIMKYVGATNNFIRWPFIVEGMIIGVLASIISIIIVGGVYNILAEQAVNSSLMIKIGMSLLSFTNMSSSIILVYMLLGIGIGAFGSVISMRKYLKV